MKSQFGKNKKQVQNLLRDPGVESKIKNIQYFFALSLQHKKIENWSGSHI